MADKLPKFIAIKVAHYDVVNYAYYMYESDDGPGYVSCKGESVFDPLAKIAVEAAKIDSKYVHLRFCHTNKYWAASDDHWIFATSNQPQEDTSKSSCTLFEPATDDDGLLYMTHVQTGGALQENPFTTNCGLYVSGSVPAYGFGFVDWDTLVKMPERVLFEGDNGKFLKAFYTDASFLQFASDDSTSMYVPQEVQLNPDGHVRVKSVYYDKFWRRRDDNWIVVDSTDDSGKDKDTLFWPIIVDGRTIVLRAAGNNEFVKRLTVPDVLEDCLSAATPLIDKYAKLVVEELVFDRSIYNVKYRMEDARIYDERPVVAGTGAAANESDTENTLTIIVRYKDKRSYTFSGGLSLSTGVTTTIQAGIPLIAETGIVISGEMTKELEWESTTEETNDGEVLYTVSVPPRSRVTVDYVATSGTCSVPFSYTQKDKSSIDGLFVTSQHNDGIFLGANYYSYRFGQHALEPLPS